MKPAKLRTGNSKSSRKGPRKAVKKAAPARSKASANGQKGRKTRKPPATAQNARNDLGKHSALREPTDGFIAGLLAGMRRTRTPGTTVAEALGVSRSRFLAWMTRGRDDETKETATIFSKLYLLVNAQEAEAEMNDSKVIASSPDFRARLARLERLRPETWSPPAKTSNVNIAETEHQSEPPIWLEKWGLEESLKTMRVGFELGFEDAIAKQIIRNAREILKLPVLPQEDENGGTSTTDATGPSKVVVIDEPKSDADTEVSRSEGHNASEPA